MTALPVRQVAGSGQAQRLHRLPGIQHVVLADGVNREFRRVAAQRNAVRGATGIPRRISDGDGNGVVALTQRADDGGRNAHAPAAVCLYYAGEDLAANGHGDDIPCRRAARLPGNNLRLALLAGVQNVVTRDSIDGDNRRGGIHREICGHGRAVARFVTDVHRQGMVSLIKGLHLAGRQRDGPGAVAAHRGVIIFAVQRHRHNLPGFRVGFATQRQRLVVLGGINDVVLRECIDGEGWARQYPRQSSGFRSRYSPPRLCR